MDPMLALEDMGKLRRLCGGHRAVPTICKLEGVVREEDRSQSFSPTVEIWKGRYKGEVVALKVLKLSRHNPQRYKFETVSLPSDPPADARSSLF